MEDVVHSIHRDVGLMLLLGFLHLLDLQGSLYSF